MEFHQVLTNTVDFNYAVCLRKLRDIGALMLDTNAPKILHFAANEL